MLISKGSYGCVHFYKKLETRYWKQEGEAPGPPILLCIVIVIAPYDHRNFKSDENADHGNKKVKHQTVAAGISAGQRGEIPPANARVILIPTKAYIRRFLEIPACTRLPKPIQNIIPGHAQALQTCFPHRQYQAVFESLWERP